MKRIFKYLKSKKGITLVLMAFMLAVLLMLAGLAIDIAYMYYVKNQLQVAADAAALAGAAKLEGCLDDGNITSLCPTLPHYSQTDARQEAWKFACKNRAANQSVFLVTNSLLDCNAPPASGLNETSNTSTEDIVVGHWRSTTPPSGVTCEPAGSGYFCPATGSTGLSINALKARPRMTGESGTPMPRVRLFIGQIFSFFGGKGWPYMSASASAIASPKPPFIGPFPICLPSCDRRSPLDAQWDYDSNPSFGNDPVECTDQLATPPGQKFFFNPSADVDRPGMAWTDFSIDACNASPDCPTSVQASDVVPFIRGTATAPDLCVDSDNNGINDIFLCTTNATAFTGGEEGLRNALRDRFEAEKKIYEFTAGSDTFEIEGWQVFVPVLSNLYCGGTHSACPGAQEGQVNPYQVTGFAKVLITEVITTGQHGLRIVGFDNPRTYSFTCKEKQGPNIVDVTRTRHITTIGCTACPAEPEGENRGARLVR